MLKKGQRRRCWKKALLQAEAQSQHGQSSSGVNAGDGQCCNTGEAGDACDATRQLTATKFVCSRVLLALFSYNMVI